MRKISQKKFSGSKLSRLQTSEIFSMGAILTSTMFLLLIVIAELEGGECQEDCRDSSCGDNGPVVRFPFRLKDRQPKHCGYPHPGFELFCTSSDQTAIQLPIEVTYEVRAINYKSQEIQLFELSAIERQDSFHILNISATPFLAGFWETNRSVLNCSSSSSDLYYKGIQTFPDGNEISSDLISCMKMYDIVTVREAWNSETLNLEWAEPNCKRCEAKGRCIPYNNGDGATEFRCQSKPGKLLEIISVLALFLLVVVIGLNHIYYSRSIDQARIEEFLEDYRALKPTRFSYEELKKITSHFKEKLGQGGYGTVYKGKLSDEHFVAVKILNHSLGHGEDFINEVGIIGRIHHLNIVRLVGFCADGYRRALVYEFLSNGSLQKYISSTDNHFLGWEKLQDIAISIAKGIEYLHHGCDQQILHFDINPNNILLDDNFNPKIADFGLAKLCAKDQSVVSMTTARGTLGYIAPEVFSRNFGNVSYKSDVYSYGMLLLEMVGGRKNTEVTRENTNNIYFPQWIYNLLEQGEDVRIHIEGEENTEIVKKLAIVGLWCIQWHPVDRPSMKVVVQMLVGEVDKLTIPPYPFASSNPTRTKARAATRHTNTELAVISELE